MLSVNSKKSYVGVTKRYYVKDLQNLEKYIIDFFCEVEI